jgi:hypothetical protein
MEPIAIISYPRSGFNLIHRILTHYFNFYKDSPEIREYNPDLSCNNPTPIVYRSHDFDGNADPNTISKMIILYRSNPIEQIDAYMRFVYCEKSELKITNHTACHATDRLYSYDEVKIKYILYKRFINKWVLTPRKNSLVIDYRQLIENPVNTLSLIQTYLFGNADNALSEKIAHEMCIERKHSISQEQYDNLKGIFEIIDTEE